MEFQRRSNLEDAQEWLVRLSVAVRANSALRHLDANIEAEGFFQSLLNTLFGWSLINGNWDGKSSQDSFDLEDRQNRIAVQVTSTMNAAKIRKTLETFIPNHRQDFDRLVFVYPLMEMPSTSANFDKQLAGFDFVASRDRLDLSAILKALQLMPDVDHQQAVVALLRKELRPLGTALQMGVDRNVAAIISIIGCISQGGLPDAAMIQEMKPDALLKLERFKEHAEFLKRQFLAHVDCYIAIDEARQAVGCDTVRVRRSGAWLREHSLSALEASDGDARRAFEALVTHLITHAHWAGHDCDDAAVRYFLADEFCGCNVFPNPVLSPG
jgi:hypothetical protein